jgi:hypothetical protein
MANAIRDRARAYIDRHLPIGTEIRSSTQSQKFLELTGTKHQTMWDNWVGGGMMTACNGFVQQYALVGMGSKHNPGGFGLAKLAKDAGKPNAWIPSTKTARPKYGDIWEYSQSLHVGVVLDFATPDQDGFWWHADAGQGGPQRDKVTKKLDPNSCDIIKRSMSKTRYDHTRLLGWIDIELYLGDFLDIPQPEWLIGWWKVNWRSQDYYYYFGRNRQATWTETAPLNYDVPPICFPTHNGKVDVDTKGGVVITWNDTGSVEKLSSTGIGLNGLHMEGFWQDVERLYAVKLSA